MWSGMASSEIPNRMHEDKTPKTTLMVVIAVVAVLVIISASALLILTANSPEEDTGIRGPISILTNDDFIPENGVKSGSGTESDPFIIDGWTITLSKNGDWGYGAYVGWTTAHFVIRNLTVTKASMDTFEPDSSTGILMHGTSNGTVSGCRISNMSEGIEIIQANNLSILANTISDCYFGIQ